MGVCVSKKESNIKFHEIHLDVIEATIQKRDI